MSQINLKKTPDIEVLNPGSGRRGYSFREDGTPCIIKENEEREDLGLSGIVENIIATQGVGSLTNRPTTGLSIGDVYVATDTLLKYTALTDTTWDVGVALVEKQFVTDSKSGNLLYQLKGTVLIQISGEGGDITLAQNSPVITLNILTLDWNSKNKLIANKATGGGVDAAADFDIIFANEENSFEGKLHLNCSADLVVTVTENLVSPDTRWNSTTNELVLLTGRYLLLIDDDVLTVSDILA